MKPEYGFSEGERGKFHHPDAAFSFQIYLEPDVDDFLSQIAEEKQIELQEFVNEWLRNNTRLVQSVQR
jgi:hypothetical protein